MILIRNDLLIYLITEMIINIETLYAKSFRTINAPYEGCIKTRICCAVVVYFEEHLPQILEWHLGCLKAGQTPGAEPERPEVRVLELIENQ